MATDTNHANAMRRGTFPLPILNSETIIFSLLRAVFVG